MFGVGVMSGVIGIVYSHELMHQKPKLERWLGDLLLASVLYSHFRSEHLQVHHRYVGTPRDPVTARMGEGFQAYFWRVVASIGPDRRCGPKPRCWRVMAGFGMAMRQTRSGAMRALQGGMALALAFSIRWFGGGVSLVCIGRPL